MASMMERIDKQKHDVWHWRRRELDEDAKPRIGAVIDVQRARREYEKNHTATNREAVTKAEAILKHVRKFLDAAEEKLRALEHEWSSMTELHQQEDYWKDRVQDLHREVIRCVKIVQQLRREEQADKLAASGEIALAETLDPEGPPIPAVSAFGTEMDSATGTVLGDALVFTNKQLTDAEARLVYAKGLWHHAQAMLARVRKKEHPPAPPQPQGGSRDKVVQAAQDCANHSGSYHYSQGGSWRMGYFPGGEPWGVRSDCSQFVTKCYYHGGAHDPNGLGYGGGFTGTLGAHGTRVNNPHPGDLCLVGYYPYHHVELIISTDGTTIGHGDARVDRSSIYNYSPRTLRSYL